MMRHWRTFHGWLAFCLAAFLMFLIVPPLVVLVIYGLGQYVQWLGRVMGLQ